MKKLSAGLALSLLFVLSSGEMTQPSAAFAQAEGDYNAADGLMRDLAQDSPTFRALAQESMSGKWAVRLRAPEEKEATKTLYDQSRAMKEGIIAIDIEVDMAEAAATNRLIGGMIDAYQVQQGLSPYVVGINPWQAVFGLQPALGAQAQTIRLAILLEIDAVHPGKELLQSTAKKDAAFAAALRIYNESKQGQGGEVEVQALRAVFKAMLQAENGLSHQRAGEAISGFTRLCMTDATKEEKGLIYSFNIQSLPVEKIGKIPRFNNLFARDEMTAFWPVLAAQPIPGPEILRAFGKGMEKWYLNNVAMYGIDGEVTEENAKRLAARAIDNLLNATESIAFEFVGMKAENNPQPQAPIIEL
ncbi:MAG TPA: hypothetical protein VIF12_03185 [Micavibrio sp.]